MQIQNALFSQVRRFKIRNVKLIISLHLRKCAGTTLKRSLKDYFKAELLFDYGDEVGSTWPSSIQKRQQSLTAAKNIKDLIQSDYSVIHGHFYKDKYDFLDVEKRYITFMRDPVSRVLSNYHYLTRNVNRKNPDSLIVNKLGFSLEEFIQHPDCRNVQSQYLRSETLNDFDFVGIVEEYNESLKKLNNMFGIELLNGAMENVNETAVKGYEVPERVVNLIKNCNLEDLRLYEKAKDRFYK